MLCDDENRVNDKHQQQVDCVYYIRSESKSERNNFRSVHQHGKRKRNGLIEFFLCNTHIECVHICIEDIVKEGRKREERKVQKAKHM